MKISLEVSVCPSSAHQTIGTMDPQETRNTPPSPPHPKSQAERRKRLEASCQQEVEPVQQGSRDLRVRWKGSHPDQNVLLLLDSILERRRDGARTHVHAMLED